jgi:hypothetical protein
MEKLHAKIQSAWENLVDGQKQIMPLWQQYVDGKLL